MRITDHSGFTLTETAVVLAVGLILTGMAIPSFDQMYRSSNADAAAQVIVQQMNYARALAVGSHVPVVLQIDFGERTITVAPGSGSARGPMILPGRIRLLPAAPVADTPDHLGATVLGAGGITEMTFLDNGAVVQDLVSNNLCSGTFFLQHQDGDAASNRAVTLLGGTGRIKVWRYDAKTSEWK